MLLHPSVIRQVKFHISDDNDDGGDDDNNGDDDDVMMVMMALPNLVDKNPQLWKFSVFGTIGPSAAVSVSIFSSNKRNSISLLIEQHKKFSRVKF